MLDGAQLVMDLEDVVVCQWGNVLLRVGTRTPQEEHIELLHETFERMLDTYPRVGLLAYLPDGAPLPDGAARLRAVSMLRSLGPRLGGMVVVAQGTGFWASAARSVITGLTLMARVAFPVKVTSSAADGCEWLGARFEPGVDAEALLRLTEQLGARLVRPTAEAS
ncbi:MAG: hypothetical protein AB1Z98_21615 [Nannocystaceae bacterium]